MLKDLIEVYEKEVDNATIKLLEQVQPLLNNFCNKYELTFVASMGAFSFSFCKNGESDDYVNENFLDELDPDLFTLLSHQLADCNSLGSQLENCYNQVSKLVYIHRHNITNKLTISQKSTYSLNIIEYGSMSLKLANEILSHPDPIALLQYY